MRTSAKIKRGGGFTISEVLVSLVVAGMGLTGTISAYVITAKRADWAVHSSAAQNLAYQRIQQVRAARWDNASSPPIDELKTGNFPAMQRPLEIPETGHNRVVATVRTSITNISTAPALRMIRVDAEWALGTAGSFTNSLYIIRSPDQ